MDSELPFTVACLEADEPASETAKKLAQFVEACLHAHLIGLSFLAAPRCLTIPMVDRDKVLTMPNNDSVINM